MKRFLYVLAAFLMLSASVFAASQQTSSTTAAVVIDRVEVYLNDSDNLTWTAGELLTWLNDGMVDIATRSLCLQATEDIDLITATIEYSITSTYITVRAVVYTDASSVKIGLKLGSPDMVGRTPEDWESASDKKPTYFYLWGGKVGVYPALSARTTETITVYYITRPTAIAAATNVTTPAIYDTALVYYVVAQAMLEDLKPTKYLQMMTLYDNELKRIRADLNEQPQVAE